MKRASPDTPEARPIKAMLADSGEEEFWNAGASTTAPQMLSPESAIDEPTIDEATIIDESAIEHTSALEPEEQEATEQEITISVTPPKHVNVSSRAAQRSTPPPLHVATEAPPPPVTPRGKRKVKVTPMVEAIVVSPLSSHQSLSLMNMNRQGSGPR